MPEFDKAKRIFRSNGDVYLYYFLVEYVRWMSFYIWMRYAYNGYIEHNKENMLFDSCFNVNVVSPYLCIAYF